MSRKCVALVKLETARWTRKHVGGILIALYDYGILFFILFYFFFCREHVYNNMIILGRRKNNNATTTHVPAAVAVAAIVDKTRRLKPMTIVVNFFFFVSFIFIFFSSSPSLRHHSPTSRVQWPAPAVAFAMYNFIITTVCCANTTWRARKRWWTPELPRRPVRFRGYRTRTTTAQFWCRTREIMNITTQSYPIRRRAATSPMPVARYRIFTIY